MYASPTARRTQVAATPACLRTSRSKRFTTMDAGSSYSACRTSCIPAFRPCLLASAQALGSIAIAIVNRVARTASRRHNPLCCAFTDPCHQHNDRANYRLHLPGTVIDRQQRVHDFRLVWTPQVQKCTTDACRTGQLGYRLLRILPASAGQQAGQRGVYGTAAQGHAGSDYLAGVCRLLCGLPRTTLEMEPLGRVRADPGCRIADVQGVRRP